jgi:hypothetical protein
MPADVATEVVEARCVTEDAVLVPPAGDWPAKPALDFGRAEFGKMHCRPSPAVVPRGARSLGSERLVAAVRATGRPIQAINPTAVERYRQRHTVARRESDHGEAVVRRGV